MDIIYDNFCLYFEGILSKTAPYLTMHMQNAWTGNGDTRLIEYGSMLCITIKLFQKKKKTFHEQCTAWIPFLC